MEDMKGDMGGAAAVIGTMHALAERKANVNVVGLVGCVENMPSGNAVRPGDIVKSMSGQTIEVINTDAEGRLVLADVLWYAQEHFKPKVVIDLATLTGAIMIALGKEYAGMFVNDDKLADELLSASRSTGEKVWRMPLDKAFDKMMDLKNADMKNAGGRWAGAASAAAFLQRFVQKDTSGAISISPAPRWTAIVTTSIRAGARAGVSGCSTGSLPSTTRRARSDGRGTLAFGRPDKWKLTEILISVSH